MALMLFYKKFEKIEIMMNLETKIPPPIVATISGIVISASSTTIDPFEFYGAKLIAILFLTLSFTLIVISIKKFNHAETSVNPINPKLATKLVTTGTYSVSRNPMYLGLVGILCGISIFLGSWFGFLIIPTFVLYLNKYQITPEERTMNALFKDEYLSYCNKVTRWL
jgi:protein-S-isoprenylcysteine O-methyltransferase Ste14